MRTLTAHSLRHIMSPVQQVDCSDLTIPCGDSMVHFVRVGLTAIVLSIFPWSVSGAPIAIGSPTVLGQINLFIDGDFTTHARLIDFGTTELTADIGNPLGSLLISPLFFGGTADGNTGNGFGGERVGATNTVIAYLQQVPKDVGPRHRAVPHRRHGRDGGRLQRKTRRVRQCDCRRRRQRLSVRPHWRSHSPFW